VAPKKEGSTANTSLRAWSRKWRERPEGWWDEVVVGEALGDWREQEGDLAVDVWHPDYPGWTFVLTFAAHGAVVGFQVIANTDHPRRDRASSDAPSITRRFLKDVPFGELEESVRQFMNPATTPMPRSTMSPQVRARYTRAFTDEPRPGKRGYEERSYAVAAGIYVETGHDIRATAERLHCSVSRARHILNRARTKGLLTAAPPGRAGGELTERARELLTEEA
jgi:hypothetical protein